MRLIEEYTDFITYAELGDLFSDGENTARSIRARDSGKRDRQREGAVGNTKIAVVERNGFISTRQSYSPSPGIGTFFFKTRESKPFRGANSY